MTDVNISDVLRTKVGRIKKDRDWSLAIGLMLAESANNLPEILSMANVCVPDDAAARKAANVAAGYDDAFFAGFLPAVLTAFTDAMKLLAEPPRCPAP